MFLQLSVILFMVVGFQSCITGHMTGGVASRGSNSSRGLHLAEWSASRGVCIRGDSASRGVGLRPGGVCIQGGWTEPPSATTGYGQQAGGTHAIGMHSCFN